MRKLLMLVVSGAEGETAPVSITGLNKTQVGVAASMLANIVTQKVVCVGLTAENCL